MKGGEIIYSIMAWCFLVWYLLVSIWVNRCVFLLSGLLRAFLILLSYFYPFGFFVILFDCHILVQNRSVSLPSCFFICFCVISSLLLVELFFVVLECPVCLSNLSTFASTFWIISSCCIVIFSCVAFYFLFSYFPASFLCFINLACFRRFLYAFPVEFLIMVSNSSLCFFVGIPISHKLISSLHRLVHLIR